MQEIKKIQPIVVTVPKGLEKPLKEEVAEILSQFQLPGIDTLHEDVSSVSLETSLEAVVYLNFMLRLGSRVLWQVGQVYCESNKHVYDAVFAIDWINIFSVHSTFMVTASCYDSFITNAHQLSLIIKDGIADSFRENSQKRPSVDTRQPQVKVHAKLYRNELFIALDTTGEPLDNRHYRLRSGTAPLRENIAAGLLRFAGWNKITNHIYNENYDPCYFDRVIDSDSGKDSFLDKQILLAPFFMDPFCGTGTFAIEAALILLNKFPALERKEWAIEYLLPNHTNEIRSCIHAVKKTVGAKQISMEKAIQFCNNYAQKNSVDILSGDCDTKKIIIAQDVDDRAVEVARYNVEKAGLEGLIEVSCNDVEHAKPHRRIGILLSNPPYGERLHIHDIEKLYTNIGDVLKNNFPDWLAYIYSGNADAIKRVGLRATRRIAVPNGNIDCKLYQYPLRKKQ